MQLNLLHQRQIHSISPPYAALSTLNHKWQMQIPSTLNLERRIRNWRKPMLPIRLTSWKTSSSSVAIVAVPSYLKVSAAFEPIDLTEDNVKLVLSDSRAELGQIFDTSVGMTGVVELVELDGPYVTISLKGRFWHERSMVLARIGNYLKQRIPEILEVEIEDEKQLDDSPENF